MGSTCRPEPDQIRFDQTRNEHRIPGSATGFYTKSRSSLHYDYKMYKIDLKVLRNSNFNEI